MNDCIGHYDRRNELCIACADSASCKQQGIECYAKAFSKPSEQCRACEYMKLCSTAGDITFHVGRHGETSIETVDDLDTLPPELLAVDQLDDAPNPIQSMFIGVSADDVLLTLLQACNSNPLTMAIVIARYGGMSYHQIARLLNTSKQLVLWRIKQIKNPALIDYLRCMKTSKHLTSSIKDVGISDTKPIQLEFEM